MPVSVQGFCQINLGFCMLIFSSVCGFPSQMHPEKDVQWRVLLVRQRMHRQYTRLPVAAAAAFAYLRKLLTQLL